MLRFAILLACSAFAQEPEPGLYGTMTTSMGVIKFKLYEKESPKTVQNFVHLAQGRKPWKNPLGRMVRTPLFNGLTFHRVIPGFMIQGGDPAGSGMGDVGFVIPDEFENTLQFDKPGVFGMANAGPNTGGAQFFITEVPTPHLDGRHTIFGQVIEGQEVVNQIARVPRGENDKPETPVKIEKVEFQRVGPVPPEAPEVIPVPKKAVPPVRRAVPPVTKKAVPPAPAKKAVTPVKK